MEFLYILIGIPIGIAIYHLQRKLEEGETIYSKRTDKGVIKQIRPWRPWR